MRTLSRVGFLMFLSPLALASNEANSAYTANCALCHQASKEGLAGQFPRLAGRVEPLTTTPAGRRFLIAVALHGMSGKIVADGKPIVGVMPPFASLADADLASALTFITRPRSGKAGPAFTARQIAVERKAGPMTTAQVHELRAELVRSGMLPE